MVVSGIKKGLACEGWSLFYFQSPLKCGIFPKCGVRMVENSLTAYGYELDPMTREIFTKYRKTHNEGVFSAYTEEMIAERLANAKDIFKKQGLTV